ncbi:MAG TPA: ribonuclease HII [Candidatus Babeliales bacterium]|nr:ribonuclease HII [Candidatus Babeliales bacterium]
MMHKIIVKNYYENLFWNQDQVICGIDEVGRGSLFGPVVAGAVILAKNAPSSLLIDSKKLTHNELIIANNYLLKHSYYALGMASHVEIEQLNIYHATLLAMQRACYNLFSICKLRPAAIVVDAMPLILKSNTYAEIPVYHFPKGEDYSSSIAAASIMAKVYRDQLMVAYDQSFPGYLLGAHKGYGTVQHQAALATKGPLFMHRKKYLSSAKQQANLGVVYAKQTAIFC